MPFTKSPAHPHKTAAPLPLAQPLVIDTKYEEEEDLVPPSPAAEARARAVNHDYHAHDVAYNADGVLVGASLAVLIEKMTPPDATVDPTFAATFFLTFRLFTSPAHLLKGLLQRYNLRRPMQSNQTAMTLEEKHAWFGAKVTPVRLRVANFLRTWLDIHWRAETDDEILPALSAFLRDVLVRTLPAMAPRLVESVTKRRAQPLGIDLGSSPLSSSMTMTSSASSSGSTSVSATAGGATPAPPPPKLTHSRSILARAKSANSLRSVTSHPNLTQQQQLAQQQHQQAQVAPPPIISKNLLASLRNAPATVHATDLDALELARQLTVMENKLYRDVKAEDLLQSGRKSSPALKAMSTFSNQM